MVSKNYQHDNRTYTHIKVRTISISLRHPTCRCYITPYDVPTHFISPPKSLVIVVLRHHSPAEHRRYPKPTVVIHQIPAVNEKKTSIAASCRRNQRPLLAIPIHYPA